MSDIEKLSSETLMKFDKLSIGTRKLELNLFWQRSLFFWGFIAATFVAYFGLLEKNSPLLILIAGFGVLSSLVWYLANRGSKWWHENWETKAMKLEEELIHRELGFELFSTTEKQQQKRPKILSSLGYSVSKLTIALSLFMFFIWTLMLLYSIAVQFIPAPSNEMNITLIILGVLFGTIFIFSVILILKARISSRENSKTQDV